MTVNFVGIGYQDIANYSIFCKSTDTFVKLEEILYKDFPELKNYENYYMVNSRRILRYKTLEENQINNNDIINVFKIDN